MLAQHGTYNELHQYGCYSGMQENVPRIKVLDGISSSGMQDAHEMGEFCLPYANFKFVHLIDDKHPETVETKW
jgi:hypothetical protein